MENVLPSFDKWQMLSQKMNSEKIKKFFPSPALIRYRVLKNKIPKQFVWQLQVKKLEGFSYAYNQIA
jgi:hypothetical protein